VATAQAIADNAPTQWLNGTLFTNYHRFASTVRILPGQNPPNPDAPVPTPPQP
jgi:hypothetical protein